MPKKFLTTLGVILLLALAGIGIWIFAERHQKNELVPPSSTQKQGTNDSSQPQQQPPAFDKTAHSTDDPASIWVIVNKKRPLEPLAYAPNDLVLVGNGQYLRSEAATALTRLIDDAKKAGLTISPLSGYRSYQTQITVYNNEVSANGQAIADSQSAKPGHSEHQTGLAIDVGGGGCGIEDCFGATAEGKWVAAEAYKYGYIVRYTADKVGITGYRAEPWHIRYIGTELAAEMHAQNITTLEEFFEL